MEIYVNGPLSTVESVRYKVTSLSQLTSLGSNVLVSGFTCNLTATGLLTEALEIT